MAVSMQPKVKPTDPSPAIIYTQGFRIANGSRYLDYTERDEALAPDPERVNDLSDDLHNIQQDPDLPKNYQGYLGYTDRRAATRRMTREEGGGGDYPTFTRDAYEISEEQHEQLVQKLSQAQRNQSQLWYGVVSFSPEFIKEAGLYDPVTKRVNQKAIKSAIKRAMPELLQREGLDNDQTFWWGDVHLNTNHVHVHLAISQTKNTRPLKPNGQPKGTFSVNSFRKFKAHVFRELQNERSRSQTLSIEKEVDQLKKTIPDKTLELIRRQQEIQRQLQVIYAALPRYKDKRKWRAKNNSREFREARLMTEQLVDRLLKNELKDDYQEFTKLIHLEDVRNRQAYGQGIKDTAQAKDKRLRELMVNRVFDFLRETPPKATTYQNLMEVIESMGRETNETLLQVEKERLAGLDPKSTEARELRRQMGYRKLYIRRLNLTQQQHQLEQRAALVEGAVNDPELRHFFVQQLQEQIKVTKLKQLPGYQLRKSVDQKQFRELEYRNVDVRKISVDQMNQNLLLTRQKQLEKEKQVLLKHLNDPGIKTVLTEGLTPDAKLIKDYYDTTSNILDLKQAINQFNLVYQDDKETRNEMTGPLFHQLKDQSRLLDHNILQAAALSLHDNRVLLKVEQNELKSFDDPQSPEARELAKLIADRKFYIRRQRLDQQITIAVDQRRVAEELIQDPAARKFFANSFREQRQYLRFKLDGDYTNPRFKALQNKYVDVQEVPIELVTQELVNERQQQLDNELTVILDNFDDPGIQQVFPKRLQGASKKQVRDYYKAAKRVLEVKQQLHENSQNFPDDPKQREAANQPLQKELDDLYKTFKRQSDNDYDRAVQQLNKQQRSARRMPRFFSVSRLIGMLQQTTRQENRARSKMLDEDDDLEREDQMEELQNERLSSRER